MLGKDSVPNLAVMFFLFILMFVTNPLHATDGTIMIENPNLSSVLVLDEDFDTVIPKNFRTSHSEFKEMPTGTSLPSRAGLDSIKMAGSAQFSQKSLEEALKSFEGPVWIVDLRKESHGFVNGIPISWYSIGNQGNADESNDNIQRLEGMLFTDLDRQRGIIAKKILEKKEGKIVKTKGYDIKINNAQTESSLTMNMNLGYLRLGVLDHHKPTDHDVDSFIEFVKTLPDEAWVYFHCRGGKGRTTTFMAMYDMLKNAKKISLEDIIKRQALLGGSDLFNISEAEDDLWKKEDAIERKEFITKFYKYAKNGYPKRTWSEWTQKKSLF